ncbi:hypothetical protein GF339_12575 [candidate division KSB3 bacterium]|uniref:CheW-like domain-containing protein n=1 Tax=candidate division KSB3 bacterium TaxID=2044937 RepID=A0A9D5JWY2_9BACT|nr:hypothetical protein [candidate division KSB3 bacterium]MBD3325417.1 hypothetical protein [candidate division KSB3 bacterium]
MRLAVPWRLIPLLEKGMWSLMEEIGIIKFQVEGINFGTHADHILEIVSFSEARSVPRPLPYVVGLTELRRHLVVVVDFRKRLGLSPFPVLPGTTMIVTKISFGMVGLLVDSISHFRKIPEAHLLPAISVAGFPEYLLHGVVTEDNGELMILPDLEKILTSYIRIHLLPITPAETIAFQYRFTPGALTRTLENTVRTQHFLEPQMLTTLPRSMSMPSVAVHKVTTYYPEFHPSHETRTTARHSAANLIQGARAGDERYLSLSQAYTSHRKAAAEHDTQAETPVAPLPPTASGGSEPPEAVPNTLEEILHLSESFVIAHLSGKPVAPQMLISRPALGRNVAKTCRISPTQLTKYLTYHESPEAQPSLESQPGIPPSTPSQPASPPSLDARLAQFFQAGIPVERLLQRMSDERYPLTRRHVRQIAEHYQMPVVKIAKLCLHFPDLTLDLQEGSPPPPPEPPAGAPTPPSAQEPDPQAQLIPHSTGLRQYAPSRSLTHSLRALAQDNLLCEDYAVRYVASRLRIPTCRLSKVRSYYTFREDS